MRNPSARILALIILCLAATPAVRATCGGGGGGGVGGMNSTGGMTEQVYFVPWKVLNPGDAPVKGNLILYWLPATREEIKRSELLTSRQLSIFATLCVGMQVVRPDDAAMIDKLGETGKLPAVVLADLEGKSVVKLDTDSGTLRLSAVEKLVRDELGTREGALDKTLKEANAKNGTSEKDAAIDLYKQVWEQRCLFPRKAREAQKALKKLGVVVQDARLRTVDPIVTAALSERIEGVMHRGLIAELDANYVRARSLYLEASRLDPADPVPLRYLGELYRHHLGDWVKARATFERLLAMQADPLSRAVALHGIGKMTIHEGDSKTGLALFLRAVDRDLSAGAHLPQHGRVLELRARPRQGRCLCPEGDGARSRRRLQRHLRGDLHGRQRPRPGGDGDRQEQ